MSRLRQLSSLGAGALALTAAASGFADQPGSVSQGDGVPTSVRSEVDEPLAADHPSDDLSADVAFREAVGLDSELETIQRLLENPEAVQVRADYGFALSREELEQVQAQIVRQDALATAEPKLRAGFADRFAGASIDQRANGLVTVYLVDATDRDLPEIANLLPPDTPITLRDVEYSLMELESVSGQISRDQDNDPQFKARLAGWAVDVKTNSVQIGVVKSSTELTAELTDRYGARVGVRVASLLEEDNRTSWPPMASGKSINNGASVCTAGPLVHDNQNNPRIMTAGHCLDDTGAAGLGPQPWRVYQNAPFGLAKANKLYNGSWADVGFLGHDPALVANCFFYSDATCPPYAGAANPAIGAVTLMSGRTSGVTAGEVLNNDISVNRSNGVTTHHQHKATYLSDDGDSGAPIASPTAFGIVAYYGSHSGRIGAPSGATFPIYSPWLSIAKNAQVTFG